MRKQLAAVGLTAGLAVGGVAGFAFTSGTTTVGAQGGTATTAPAPGSKGERPDPSAHLQETLKPLVDDGTITQAQADKVIEALIAARPTGPDRGGPGGRGGRGGFDMRARFGLEAAAKALGMTTDDLRTELRTGQSIAAVAKAKGVDLSKVTDALIGEATTRINAQVADSKITQAQADKRIAALKERIAAMVNGELPAGGPGVGGWGNGPRGDHVPGEVPPVDAPSTTAPTTTEG